MKIKNFALIAILFLTLFFISGCVLNQEKTSQKDKNNLNQRYYCEQDSDCELYAHVCECLNFKYMTGGKETFLKSTDCTKEEFNNTICSCVNNQCQNKNFKCKKWEAGLCEAVIGPGYHYNSGKNQCEYFKGGSGCRTPYFRTLEECENVCSGNKKDKCEQSGGEWSQICPNGIGMECYYHCCCPNEEGLIKCHNQGDVCK
ncbi:hypothetical protein K8R66_03210 [bacterium]|nr:hypothetical protein [bacterium]